MFSVGRVIVRGKPLFDREVVEAVAPLATGDASPIRKLQGVVRIAEGAAPALDGHPPRVLVGLDRNRQLVLALRLERRAQKRRERPLRLPVDPVVAPDVDALVVEHRRGAAGGVQFVTEVHELANERHGLLLVFVLERNEDVALARDLVARCQLALEVGKATVAIQAHDFAGGLACCAC